MYEVESYACSDGRTSALSRGGDTPSVIMVHIGTNDWGAGLQISRYGSADLTLFSVAYGAMLKKLKDNYKNAEIWCLTLPINTCAAIKDYKFSPCYGGTHILKYCEAIRECANAHRCKLIDLYASGIEVDTVDGFHPSKRGMEAIANAVISAIERD